MPIELDRVHRFTHHWERDATLRLRAGDPDIADLYQEQGRLHGGTPDAIERAAVAAWWSHRQAGETVALTAPTNDTVDRLNQRAQQQRVRAGELDPDGRHVDLGTVRLYVGDEIATRRNDRHLVTDRGEMIRNRAQWTITAIHPDHSLTATGRHGHVHLPARYVADHVELAYATTATAAQGRTVDHALLVVDRPCDVRNLYVGMSRGTESNHAYLAVAGRADRRRRVRPLCGHRLDRPTRPHPPRRTPRRTAPSGRPARRDRPAEPARAPPPAHHRARTGRRPPAVPAGRDPPHRDRAGGRRADHRRSGTAPDGSRGGHRRLRPAPPSAPPRPGTPSRTTELAGIPNRLSDAADQVAAAHETLSALHVTAAENRELLTRRPEIEADIADLDDQLDHDLRLRTRVTRREQPDSVVAVLGAASRPRASRPPVGPRGRPPPTAPSRLRDHLRNRTATP